MNYMRTKTSQINKINNVIFNPENFNSGVIEAVMMKMNLPSVYVKETGDCKYIPLEGCVLDSLLTFIKDETPLQGMKFLKEHEGKTFSELDFLFQNRIGETNLTINVFDPKVSVEEAKEMISLLG